MVMRMRSSRLSILERRTFFRLFIREKPRSHTEVSTAKHITMATARARCRAIVKNRDVKTSKSTD